ncbi:hypothetical protein [Xenorhabdus ishibashii]|uniref:Uncharacterized protein n=1 Tax=Xenorhabdus ishibashii TaxID=1034471 RepID=A0A2D0KDQ5_9GAMM|nr:hypothetical protein [Xenorhabdus ishibashii]PHM61561.1 hypothetical protein Xish_00697 [Xenorhabdus ishibashii]
MQNPEQPLSINQPIHPKDGAIQGMATLTLPLKVASGNRAAPALTRYQPRIVSDFNRLEY